MLDNLFSPFICFVMIRCHLSSNGIMTLYRCSSDDSSHDVNLKSVKVIRMVTFIRIDFNRDLFQNKTNKQGRISLMNCSIHITDEPSFQVFFSFIFQTKETYLISLNLCSV